MIEVKNTVNNKSIKFDNKLVLLAERELSYIEASHTSFKGMYQDGEYYLNSNLNSRDLSIVGYIQATGDELKHYKRYLISLVNPLNKLEIINGEYKIEGYATSTVQFQTDANENNAGICKFLIEVYCPNPFYTSLNKIKTDIALWQANFSFDLEIPEQGIEFEYREPSLIVNIDNVGDVKTGMIIEFRALGTVNKPSLFNINTREYFKINKVMTPGEIVLVNTNYGQKKVEIRTNGQITNIMHLIDPNSIFLQLDVGDNLLRYDAEQNLDNLEVSIYHSPRLLGV